MYTCKFRVVFKHSYGYIFPFLRRDFKGKRLFQCPLFILVVQLEFPAGGQAFHVGDEVGIPPGDLVKMLGKQDENF